MRPLRNDAGPLAFSKLVSPGADLFFAGMQSRFLTVLCKLIAGCVCVCIWMLVCL